MLRRSCPLNNKHLLMSDSETESDDDEIVVVQIKKRNGKRKTINTQSHWGKKKGGHGKKMLSSIEGGDGKKIRSSIKKGVNPFKLRALEDQDALLKLATLYQNHMNKIHVPTVRVPDNTVFVNWKCLVKTLKTLYGQPLHYRTYMLCKQWDELRFGIEDRENTLFKRSSAEDTLWTMEEKYRLCTSPDQLAKLWLNDPEFRVFVDDVIPPCWCKRA